MNELQNKLDSLKENMDENKTYCQTTDDCSGEEICCKPKFLDNMLEFNDDDKKGICMDYVCESPGDVKFS
jgi:hypothetical protein